MRVFVAGATGAIGRPLVRQLVAAGHEVHGTTRSPERAETIRADGAEPVVVDALDRDALARAVAATRPDTVVHQLTQIPADTNPRAMAEEFEATNRLRSEGTRNLVDAAREAGAGRLVAQSIAFAYRFAGSGLNEEDDALLGDDAPAEFRSIARSVQELERTVLDADGIVLRYGWFYGPGTAYAPSDGSLAARVRKRGFPIIGSGDGVYPFIHVEDAAGATVAAVERGTEGAVYNVVDDHQAPVRDWLPAYAEAIGAKAPLRVPALASRVAVGQFITLTATEARGVSNEKAKRELGWSPRYPSLRDGLREDPG